MTVRELNGMAPAGAWQVYTDIQGLAQLKRQARTDERGALENVARQFEALFIEMVLKEARKVNFDDGGLMSSERIRFFQDWQDRQLAQDLAARGGIGLAERLVKQLAPPETALSPAALDAWRQAHPDAPLTTEAVLRWRRQLTTGGGTNDG